MCGKLLEAGRPIDTASSNIVASTMPSPDAPRTPPTAKPVPASPRSLVVDDVPRSAPQSVPPISGPSMLGLSQPGASQAYPPQPATTARPNQSYEDPLPNQSFSGLDSFLEPEQPSGGRRVLLLAVLLVALGAAGWWTFSYLRAAESRKSQTPTTAATPEVGDSSSDNSVNKSSGTNQPTDQSTTPAPAAGSAQSPGTAVPEGPSENASPIPDTTQKPAAPAARPTPKPVPAKPKPTRAAKLAEKREAAARIQKSAEPAPAPTGDADFRRGEAYLYGRGVPENCAEAIKNLKAASAASSAKAKSAFGTMYATGHCVPRDLPTSYLWFAMALRADPNNQILEKDLNAVWNQMTPPERQQATRMKQ